MSDEVQMSLSMIDDINRAVKEDEVDLSAWETGFIETVTRQLGAGEPLGEKYDNILDRIWKKAKGEES